MASKKFFLIQFDFFFPKLYLSYLPYINVAKLALFLFPLLVSTKIKVQLLSKIKTFEHLCCPFFSVTTNSPMAAD